MPDALRLEARHQSSIAQHFGSDPTNLGYDSAGIGFVWKRGNFRIEAMESVPLDDTPCPRCKANDLSELRVGYEIPLRHP